MRSAHRLRRGVGRSETRQVIRPIGALSLKKAAPPWLGKGRRSQREIANRGRKLAPLDYPNQYQTSLKCRVKMRRNMVKHFGASGTSRKDYHRPAVHAFAAASAISKMASAAAGCPIRYAAAAAACKFDMAFVPSRFRIDRASLLVTVPGPVIRYARCASVSR